MRAEVADLQLPSHVIRIEVKAVQKLAHRIDRTHRLNGARCHSVAMRGGLRARNWRVLLVLSTGRPAKDCCKGGCYRRRNQRPVEAASTHQIVQQRHLTWNSPDAPRSGVNILAFPFFPQARMRYRWVPAPRASKTVINGADLVIFLTF